MKKLGILFFLAFISSVSFGHEINQPHISVVGTAKKEVVPDVMKWSIRVENKGVQLTDVSKKHSALVKDVLAIARKHKVAEEKLQATGMSFGENYVYRNNSRVKEGYIASTSIFFELRDFSKYEPVWLAFSKIKEVSVDWVDYDYSKKIEARNAVQIEALENARSKAKSMAAVMGQEIGEVLVIREHASGGLQQPVSRARGAAFAEASSAKGSPVSPGSLTIETSINFVAGLVSK